MNIQNENKGEQIKILSIEILPEDYQEKVEDGLKKVRRTVSIPGFRIGKAPMQLIKRNYEKSIIADTVERIVSDEIQKFISDNKLQVLGEPLPDNDQTSFDLEHSDKFHFTFEIACQKPFDLDYGKVPSFTRYQIVADDSEIDNYISELQKRYGKYSSPETIGENDFVTVSYPESQSGNFHFEDLNNEGQKLFKGKKANDVVKVDVNTIFTSDVPLAAFLRTTGALLDKSKPNELELTISYIGHLDPAEINDEFFKKAFPDGSIKTVEDMRKDAALHIEQNYAPNAQNKFMNDAIDALLKHLDIEIPEEFMKKYILSIQKDMTPDSLNEKYADYEKSFRWQLLENKLATENDIKITEDDIKQYVRTSLVNMYFQNFDAESVSDRIDALVEDTLRNKETRKNIYDRLFDDEIGKVLLNKMKTTVKKVTMKEFTEIIYNIKPEDEAAPKAKKTAAKKTSAKKAATEGEVKEVKEENEAKETKEEKPKAKKTTAKTTASKTKKSTPKAE